MFCNLLVLFSVGGQKCLRTHVCSIQKKIVVDVERSPSVNSKFSGFHFQLCQTIIYESIYFSKICLQLSQSNIWVTLAFT